MNFYGEMYLEFDRRFVRNGKLFNDDPLPIKVYIDELLKFQKEAPPPPVPQVRTIEKQVFIPMPCRRAHNDEWVPTGLIDEISRLAPRARHEMESQEAYTKRIQNFNSYRERILKVMRNYKP